MPELKPFRSDDSSTGDGDGDADGDGDGDADFVFDRRGCMAFFRRFGFLFLCVILFVFFLIHNTGYPASFLCYRSPEAKKAEASAPTIPYPHIARRKITKLFADPSSLKADKWITVALPNPSDTTALTHLSRIPGWQVLAVGDSETPSNWSLNGVVFLSLEKQAGLRFQITDFLPYKSYLRKNIGYLYAIQHGARIIFDADAGISVTGGDLGKVFDLDLSPGSTSIRNPTLLQYDKLPHGGRRRRIVNPYIHFGQPSVWPRGLPLEKAGELDPEEYYATVPSGNQFIQQGLINGLPDVDSIFYLSRKTKSDTFDIHFDEEAPVVVVPEGVVAPVNSLNTLFKSEAFWALMLPVSVSTMASDIIRGYWAQRLLWEISGFVAVYPPMADRLDRTSYHSYADEKELHVNVSALVEFLMSWRSNGNTLYKKILQLSYDMAKQGFWTEKDVRLTAAWLHDLIAVGYREPRMMTLEMDFPVPKGMVIPDVEKRDFVPQKLPSVHLGVVEAGGMVGSGGLGDLIAWRNNFGNVVLVMYCASATLNRTSLDWRLLYGRIFKTVVVLSEQRDYDLAIENADLGLTYKYLPNVFEQFTGAEGFLFIHEDVILNYWNLLKADKRKLWITNQVPKSWTTVTINRERKTSNWLIEQGALLEKILATLPYDFQSNYKNGIGGKRVLFEFKFIHCSSDIFYIPQHFVPDFKILVGLVGDLKLHHKVALPMFFMAMDSVSNFDSNALASTIYRTDNGSAGEVDYMSYYSAEAAAVHPCHVRDELDFAKLIRNMAKGDTLLKELV